MIGFIIGFFVGGTIATFIVSLIIVGKDDRS